MKKQRVLVLLAVICLVALLLPMTVSATEVQNGFSADGNYYYIDGQMVCNAVIQHEGYYYGFNWDGWLYRDEYFWNDGYRYLADSEGRLCTNGWYDSPWGGMWYFDEQGRAYTGFLEVDGALRFLQDGELVYEGIIWSEEDQSHYVLTENGYKFTKVGAGWNQVDGGWYYLYEEDGNLYAAQSEIKMIYQKKYGKEVPLVFDYNGRMVTNEVAWLNGGTAYANGDGVAQKNTWIQYYGDWYYFGEEYYGLHDFAKIGGVWYYFEDGRMCADEAVYSDEYNQWYALNAEGNKHTALSKIGWNSAYGQWYYLVSEEGYTYLAQGEVVQIGGKLYYFNYQHKLMTNDRVDYYDPNQDQWVAGVADADGVLSASGWYKCDGQWRYLQDGRDLEDGAYEIDGKLYMFDGYDLVTFGGYYESWRGEHGEYYVTDKTGVLYRNTWLERKIIWPSEIGWVYFGADGKMLCNTVAKIGGSYYAFDDNGTMLTNTVRAWDGVAYQFGADGKGKAMANGWHQIQGDWLYVLDGGLAEGMQKIDGVYYYFYDGYMAYETYIWAELNGVYGRYLVGADGKVITKAGWYKMYRWFYLNADYTLAIGWVQSSGKWYYMSPYMVTDEIFYDYDEDKVYYADGNGVCKALSGNGIRNVDGGIYYLESGKPLCETWKKVGGYWYYFGEYYHAYTEGAYEIEGKRYLFDEYGKLLTGGWVSDGYDWFYADPQNDNALVTGLKTIGGKKYCFDEYGVMFKGHTFSWEDVYYIAGTDGVIKTTFSGTGWVKVGNDWYYSEDGCPVRDSLYTIGGKTYGFDGEGRMLYGGIANCWYETYYFDANGVVQTGWIKVGNDWVYGNPEYKWLDWGHCYIEGKDYIFDEDHCLMTGTFTYDGSIYKTDSDGAVTSSTPCADGWVHFDNNWHYIVDGNLGYTGWVGDYLIRYGTMVFDEVISYNGKLYYLKPNGQLLRGAWASDGNGGYWYLAKADGSLYCSEWVQKGGAWYYFEGYYMVTGACQIGDELHRFDENGKWLGKIKEENNEPPEGLSNGWHKLGGYWYYYKDGAPYWGEHTIDGKTYYFADNGIMLSNMPFGDYMTWRYYGADGAAVEAVGWKYLNGAWYYFNPDHTLYFGMAKDSAGWCYVYLDYDSKKEAYVGRLATNEYLVVGGSLYYFNSSGSAKSAISANGWYKAGSDWYYFENGALISDGYHVIGGAGYYFYDGMMYTNTIEWVDGKICYFGADGKRVTKAGWHKMVDRWVYVNEHGRVYEHGIYIIGGKEYTFSDFVLISE